jgi:hypothetical protein
MLKSKDTKPISPKGFSAVHAYSEYRHLKKLTGKHDIVSDPAVKIPAKLHISQSSLTNPQGIRSICPSTLILTRLTYDLEAKVLSDFP